MQLLTFSLGDILDKRGNTVGHAERYEEPEAEQEEEAAPADLSEMKGLKLNKNGNVIGPDGVPIGRLVEGNAKELAGRRVDGEGQIWDDTGKVVGRVELIPPQDREAKPEGPFAGLEGLVVVKDGWVEDSDGNRVGRVTEGDPKKLVGQKVDEGMLLRFRSKIFNTDLRRWRHHQQARRRQRPRRAIRGGRRGSNRSVSTRRENR